MSLRLITSAMAIVGILAACQLADTRPMLALLGTLGTAMGSYVSYIRRDSDNTWIKWSIAVCMIIVLGQFLEDIIYRVQSSIADARAPLTNMLIALQCLHSFDLPKRRDLSISALVGLTLISSAATLSRDLTFGIYLISFLCFGSYMLYLDCVSRTSEDAGFSEKSEERTASRPTSKRHFRLSPPVVLATFLPLTAVGLFLIMPKLDIGFLHNVRVSLRLNLPFLQSNRITNPMLSHARFRDGSLPVNPLAYFGFDEELDLNYRGRLSNEIVMKVSCPQGAFLRAMAFDTYDGHHWTMSQPKKTYDRLNVYGVAIPLAPVPGLPIPARVAVSELTQVVQMEVDQPNLIPAAAIPNLIYFPTNKVEVDYYGALRSPMLMERDMAYTVLAQVPKFDLNEMRQAPGLSPLKIKSPQVSPPNYLQLPLELPEAVRKLGLSVGGSSDNRFAQAEQIDRFLKLNYRYNFNLPPTPPDQDAVADFLLKRKSGYCEHFASAFVVLCRINGIPARLVTGFTPGEYNPFTGLWEIRMKNAHAWAEIYTPSWGWVPFDPTPDGAPPGFSEKYEQSSLDYFSARLSKFLDYLSHTGQFKNLSATLSAWLKPLPAAISWLSFFVIAVWQPLAVLLGLAGLLFFMFKLVPLWTEHVSEVNQKAEQEIHPSTREYLRLCRDLKLLQVERSPQDTACELKQKVRHRLVKNPDIQLSGLVDNFLEIYSRSRFSNAAGDQDLVSLGNRIHEQLQSDLLATAQAEKK